MTDKRFVDYFDKDHNYIIQDLQNEDEYQVGFVNCDEDVFLELINQLSDENEQLKQFKEYVFNKIDMHLRMLPTARDNEFDEDDGDPSLYVGAIYMLEILKKELEE